MRAIGVVPSDALTARTRLFAAVAMATGVRFVPGDDGGGAPLDAIVAFGREPGRSDVRSLVFAAEAPSLPGKAMAVETSATAELDRALRGQEIDDVDAASARPLTPGARTTVLASGPGGPMWLREGGSERVAVVPGELEPDEPLRERLRAGRWLGVLTLLRFAREIAASDWAPPLLEASIVLDDPNLHWRSYGFVDFEALAVHARQHEYHVAMAMVPLDAWFAHPRAVRLFRAQPEALSLLIHGNDHVRHELGRTVTVEAADRLAHQALKRIERFERRCQLDVARVMAPPHNACAEPIAGALRRAGFEALCTTRPYAWRSRPPAGRSLTGVEPIDIVDNLPVLPRLSLHAPRGELALRAWLGQPLIVYGHHEDVADGLAVFARLAEDVRGLGEVRWRPPGEIARSRAETRRDGKLLQIRMYARRLDLRVPEGVERVAVDLASAYRDAASERLLYDGRQVELGASFAVRVGERLTLVLDARNHRAPPRAPLRPLAWPLARRALVQLRDRSQPLVARRRPQRAGRGGDPHRAPG